MNLVLLIVDPKFDHKPEFHLQSGPIWIAESKANREALENSRTSCGPITWFPLRKGESAEQVFARIVQSLDQHHNELAQVPPYDTLDVYGISADKDILNFVRDLGFVSQIKQSRAMRLLKPGAEESAI